MSNSDTGAKSVEERIKVLFMVMEFAPLNTTGNFRSLKFVKYFREHGIEPIVVTFTPESAANLWPKARIDDELLDEIPEETTVYRIPAEDRRKHYSSKLRSFITVYFHIEDNVARLWKANLMEAIDDIIEKHKPQVLLTSVPPFSSGGLAAHVSRKFSLPLVIDMRDAWSQWGHQPFGSYLHYLLTLRKERSNFKTAKAIVGVTPQLIRDFARAHPGLDKNKFHFIPNGFDDDTEIPSDIETSTKEDKKVIIGYVGSFYYSPHSHKQIFMPWWKRKRHRKLQYVPVKENWKYRSPYFFLKTLARAFEKAPKLKSRVEFHFVGRIPEWLGEMLGEFDLKDNFKSYGFVPHSEALRIQKSFDYFLTTSEKVEGGDHYCLPSKIFDYVRMRKPILAFVTAGIQREFISKSGLGLIMDPDDTENASTQLMEVLKNGIKLQPNPQYLQNFHRRNITQNMSGVIKTVI
ncbi:MAG: glycosyltransferase [Bacteroidota bacterium]